MFDDDKKYYKIDKFGRTYSDYFGRRYKPSPNWDKNIKLRTDLHYSDPEARKLLNVFGEEKRGLFYNYSDRIEGWDSKKWRKGLELAKEGSREVDSKSQYQVGSARYFEVALNHFHDVEDVNMGHIILGCNISTGYSYLVFGYRYTTKKENENA